MPLDTTMETYTGRRVDLALPRPSSICIEDIAWHLSRQARFLGATTSGNVYSVAQHSVIVLNRVRATVRDPNLCLLICALLHDGHEAYIGDIIRPMGRLLELRLPLLRLKSKLQHAIYKGLLKNWRYGGGQFEEYTGDIIHQADNWAGMYEAYHLMHSKGNWYTNPVHLEEEFILRTFIVWTPQQAHDAFLSHYRDLTS